MDWAPLDGVVSYLVEIRSVREVTLICSAELTFWREHLRREDLFPCAYDGAAQVLIGGTDMRWMGIRLRELTISVAVSASGDGSTLDGYYLAHAWNSRSVLAWMERTFFRTPYTRGAVEVDPQCPARIRLRAGREAVLEASMAGPSRHLGQLDGQWTGSIFLPRPRTSTNRTGDLFHARLGGITERYAFEPAADTLVTPGSSHAPVWRWLAESGLAGHEWRLCDNATHARSRTFTRTSPRG